MGACRSYIVGAVYQFELMHLAPISSKKMYIITMHLFEGLILYYRYNQY